MRWTASGSVEIAARCHKERIGITVRVANPIRSGQLAAMEGEERIAVARRMAGLVGGALSVSEAVYALTLTLTLPSAQRVIVAAIEDNRDTLQLWKRYLVESPVELVGIRDPLQALETVIECRPHVIILDVMMPGLDGWDLLGRLRHHPDTGDIPVIVCTVLPQQELAISLGASDFIAKPTTQRVFREVLERQLAAPGRGSRPGRPSSDRETRGPVGASAAEIS